jgi:DNA-directed RNA polymerase subunit omega
VTSLQKQIDTDESEDGEMSEKADSPEFDKMTEDEYIRAIKASGMTTPQSLPKG